MENIFNPNYFSSILNIYSQGKGYVIDKNTNETFYIGRNRLKGALDKDLVKVSLNYTITLLNNVIRQ